MKRIVYDQTKCVGCRVCEAICSFTNYHESNPTKARGKILRTVTDGLLTKIRITCLQCEKPMCMEICPASAISENAEGVKTVDTEKCLGCRMCEIACPVGAIHVHPDTEAAVKCDQCMDEDEPQCVKYCYSKALSFVDNERMGYVMAREKSSTFLEQQAKET
jgi:carbon-monoxide dehydrogenase iron sulfur subunit